jgi:hypothetical protein
VLTFLALLAASSGPHASKLRFGVIVGEPLALTLATDLAEGLALHSDLGLSFSGKTSGTFATDIVYRSTDLFGPISEDLWLLPFVGFGLRAALGEDEREDLFGFRVPLGVTLVGASEAIELFAYAAVGIAILPERRATLDSGAGIRFGF